MTTATATTTVRALTDGTHTLYRVPGDPYRRTTVRIAGADLREIAYYGSTWLWWLADGAPQPIEIAREGGETTTLCVDELDVAETDGQQVIRELVEQADGTSFWGYSRNVYDDCDREFKRAAARRDLRARTPEAMAVAVESARTYTETVYGKLGLANAPEITVEHIGTCEPFTVIFEFFRHAPDSAWHGKISIMARRESRHFPECFGPGSVIDPPQWLVDAIAGIVPAEGLACGNPMLLPPERVTEAFQPKPARARRRR